MTAALEEYWAVEGSEVTLGSGLSCCLCDPADLERSAVLVRIPMALVRSQEPALWDAVHGMKKIPSVTEGH